MTRSTIRIGRRCRANSARQSRGIESDDDGIVDRSYRPANQPRLTLHQAQQLVVGDGAPIAIQGSSAWAPPRKERAGAAGTYGERVQLLGAQRLPEDIATRVANPVQVEPATGPVARASAALLEQRYEHGCIIDQEAAPHSAAVAARARRDAGAASGRCSER